MIAPGALRGYEEVAEWDIFNRQLWDIYNRRPQPRLREVRAQPWAALLTRDVSQSALRSHLIGRIG